MKRLRGKPEAVRRRTISLWILLSSVLASCGAQPPSTEPSVSGSALSPSPPLVDSPGGAPASVDLPSPALRDGPPRLEKVGDFEEPAGLFSPPGDPRLFVVERGGRIQVVAPEGGRKTFLDIRKQVLSGGERGLLSLAFPPDYAESGLAYVYYTDTEGDSRIVEFKADAADPNRLDPTSRRELLFVDQPFANHNGGLLLFDPSGMMMIGLGDGGGSGDPGNRAQDLGDLLGKLLRIDPKQPQDGRPYGIPKDNPYLARAGARPEVWAYGLRNPWRYAFDSDTKDLFVADVGQNRYEEVNYVPPASQPGANYGWRKYEGRQIFKNQRIDESRLVTPILTYPLNRGTCSVVGGNVYRGSVAALRGFYLYADYCGSHVNGFKVAAGSAVDRRSFQELRASSIAAFGEDASRQMYVVSLDGPVFRIS